MVKTDTGTLAISVSSVRSGSLQPGDPSWVSSIVKQKNFLNSLISVELYISGRPPHPMTTLHALLQSLK